MQDDGVEPQLGSLLDDAEQLCLLLAGGQTCFAGQSRLNTVATQAARNSRAGSGAFSFTGCQAPASVAVTINRSRNKRFTGAVYGGQGVESSL